MVPNSAEAMTAILAAPPRAQPAARTASAMIHSPDAGLHHDRAANST